MSAVANVERKIRRVEGFDVRILHLRGADVRGDRMGLPQYGFRHAAPADFRVDRWKKLLNEFRAPRSGGQDVRAPRLLHNHKLRCPGNRLYADAIMDANFDLILAGIQISRINQTSNGQTLSGRSRSAPILSLLEYFFA